MAGKFNRERINVPSIADIEKEVEKSTQEETALNEMFRVSPKKEEVVEVNLSDIRPFGGDYGSHRFRIRKEKVEELAESIQQVGMLTPMILRHDKTGQAKYECIAGHTRREGALLAGEMSGPAVIRNYDDEEAELVMAATNHQREDLYPSEKAWMYRIEYDALKRASGRKKNGDPLGHQKKAIDLLAEKSEDSRNQIQRFMRLTHLNEFLLDKVDQGKIPVRAGVELSYLTEKEQTHVNTSLSADKTKVDMEKAALLKKLSQEAKAAERELTVDEICAVLEEKAAPKQKTTEAKIAIPEQLLDSIPGWRKKNKKYVSQYAGTILELCFRDEELRELIQRKINLEAEEQTV